MAHTLNATILILAQIVIVSRYVKGFKIDRQKVANVVGAKDRVDPLVDTSIHSIVRLLNRSVYLRMEVGWEPATTPDGERPLVLIIALEIGADKDELEKKDLGEIDESIKWTLPHVLVGPGCLGTFRMM